MRFLIQIKAIFITVFLLVFILLPVCFIAIPFNLKRRLKIVCPVWALCQEFFLRHACLAKIDIQEDYRSPELRGIPAYGLYVANHQSFMDIPLIITMYQVPPIMKKEVLYIPMVGLLAWISGAMPVARDKQGSRKRVFDQTRHRMISERIGIQVYPEGTRSKDAFPKEMKSIKKTLMVFAYNEGIPVVPTSIYGTRGVLSPKGVVQPGRHVGIIVHKEINPKDYKTSDEFCEASWSKVIEGHRQMHELLGHLNKSLS